MPIVIRIVSKSKSPAEMWGFSFRTVPDKNQSQTSIIILPLMELI